MTRFWKVPSRRFRGLWIWHLWMTARSPKTSTSALRDTFAFVHYTEHRLIDAQPRSRRSCNIAVHTREFSVEPSHGSRGHLGVPSIVIPQSYDDGLSGHLKAIHHQCRKLNDSSRRDRYSSSFSVVWLTR